MWKSLFLILCLSFTTLSAQVKVLTFAGSAREGSANKKLAKLAAKTATELGADATFIDLKDYPIPLYNEDLETKNGMPENAKSIRQLMIGSQVIIIASPEYNASLTALLKNTLDWASRSEKGGSSREAFQGKKFVIMSASPGARGGARGLVHLRAVIENIGGTILPEQIVIPDAYNAFDEKGDLKDPKLAADLRKIILNSISP